MKQEIMSNNIVYQNSKPHQFMEYNPAYEQQQQQIQIQKLNQKQYEEVQSIRYYIYDNLQFLINLLYSSKAVNEHFENDPQHPMRIIARNKITLQLNLSNSIQFDQSFQYKSDSKLNQVLQMEKQNAKQLLEQLSPEFKQEFANYLEIYKKSSLDQNIEMRSLNLEQTNLETKFDSNVLQSIINSIQQVDKTTQQFREQKAYNIPNIQDILTNANNYYEKTKQQLDNNYPNQNQIQIELQEISLKQDLPTTESKKKRPFNRPKNGKKNVGIQKRKIYKDTLQRNKNHSNQQHQGDSS
ncbi:unnamed protein product (macronuclear) [Paramecium tetraurelia]|uniref:Uncharacterized protein n=1 Tax=Paramecium tetraurelia TaxID=5888 RepID=A0EE42_PARTE|nr:uncharacterized protein GSPATT00025903001 [Paramecium tetraurelia]CAK93559.1 unnamed protein product [Paramecium tetraurelia]|eukprot:XP_001460956.1 hypothetical protein (macronuclear) [Paramecium tetraurelia strain d4-2]